MTIRIAAETPWYDLFSRGARDWLRHNQKVREAVKDHAARAARRPRPDHQPEQPHRAGAGAHARARALPPRRRRRAERRGPGRRRSPATCCARRDAGRRAAQRRGRHRRTARSSFVVELKIDEIVDWLWEELEAARPASRSAPRPSTSPTDVREGWDKRGARSRLDRRRTIKEAVKRRAIQDKSPVAVHQRRPALPPARAARQRRRPTRR